MNDLLIVPAFTAEVELLQQVAAQSFLESFAADNTPENMNRYIKEHFSINRLTAEMSHPDAVFYFAMLKNQPIGYLKVNFRTAQTEQFNNRAVELERIYVLKGHQGQHVGQRLLGQALTLATEAGAPYLWLGVWEHNAKAIGFYKKNGFVEFDKHSFKLGDEEQTDLLMKLELPLP